MGRELTHSTAFVASCLVISLLAAKGSRDFPKAVVRGLSGGRAVMGA